MSILQDILKQYWGYDDFRSLQKEIILSVTQGRDTLALMPTGGGKSLTYQVSALAMNGICVVITPLIALMKDQVEDLQARNIPAEAIYTGIHREVVESIFNKCYSGKIKFLYISPERLASNEFRIRLLRMQICLFAIDEAHCISQWGYDFRPSYLRIAEIRESFPSAPILALTATATPAVVEDIQFRLNFSKPNVMSKSFRRENIAYVVRKTEDKPGEMIHIIKSINACTIVYVRKRENAEQLAEFLCQKGFKADFYHAGLSSYQRASRQMAWKSDETPIIVATNAFGMGIDKPDVRLVVHFDIPDSPEAYFQEAGRAGRDGKKAYAVLLSNSSAIQNMKTRISKEYPDRKYIIQVYGAICDFLQIAEGAGNGFAFEFDIVKFITIFKFDSLKCHSAIQILQLSGYWEYTNDVHARSRVTFSVTRPKLDKYHPHDELEERLLEYMMRNFEGVFVKYVFFDDNTLVDALDADSHTIYETFLNLSRNKIVSYVPGNERPYLVFLRPRLPLSYIKISKKAYDDRKQAFSDKIAGIIQYVEEKDECRQLLLMKYFGQKESEPCGICDICLSHKKKIKPDIQLLDSKIMDLLSQGNIELKQLPDLIEASHEDIIERVRDLMDREVIELQNGQHLSLKK